MRLCSYMQRLRITGIRRDADYGIQSRIHGLFGVSQAGVTTPPPTHNPLPLLIVLVLDDIKSPFSNDMWEGGREGVSVCVCE